MRGQPLQSDYLETRFGDTFSYIDNMLNQFFQKHAFDEDGLYEAKTELDHSFKAQLALKVSNFDVYTGGI